MCVWVYVVFVRRTFSFDTEVLVSRHAIGSMGVSYFAISTKNVAADGTFIARWTREYDARHMFHVAWTKIIQDRVWEQSVENI
jgi:hypothetical protein